MAKKKRIQRPVTDEDVASWRQLRKQGHTLRAIAKQADRDPSVIQKRVSGISYADPRRHEAHSAETIAEVRKLRIDGWNYEAIADQYGMGLATVTKFCNDIPKPRTRKQREQSLRAFDRKERRIQAADLAAGIQQPPADDDTPTQPRHFPEVLPVTAEGFDVSGIFPDENVVAWADQVQQRFINDRTRGVIFDGTPIDVIKAGIITSTALRPWDDTWMRQHRDMWIAIRKFTTLNVEELSERMGISASSLTRYSTNIRTPNTGDFENICAAMWEAMQTRLYNLDLWLCLHDYAAAHDLGYEDTYDMDEALRWISGLEEGDEGWDDEATLDHLPSLAHVRSLMPAPLYRDEDTILFGYLGYGEPMIAVA